MIGDISFKYLLAGGLSIGYLVLIGLALRRSGDPNNSGTLRPYLLITLVLAVLAQAVYLLAQNAHEGQYASLFIGGLTQPALAVLLASLLLVGFTALSLKYLKRPQIAAFVAVAVAWWAAIAFGTLQTPNKAVLLGQQGWIARTLAGFSNGVDVLGLAVLVGWVVLAGVIVFANFHSYYTAELAEIANRSFFWVFVFPVYVTGLILGTSGSDGIRELGWFAQFAALIAASYAAVTYRILDVRRAFRLTFTSSFSLGALALLVLLGLLIGQSLDRSSPLLWVGLALLAGAVSIAYLPTRVIAAALANRIFGKGPDDSASLVRQYNQYSQHIAGVVELKELSDFAIDAMKRAVRIKRGGLLLATRDDNETLRLESIQSTLSEMPEIRAWIPKGSPLYHAFADRGMPLLQYDLEYGREFTETAPELKSFFRQLKASAYAPIMLTGQLIGLLAAGARMNDDPFTAQDLELLQTLASQTGVALRNSRLVDDLRKARDEAEGLNQDILRTKERLEQLDSVKTDFVTIASHELRTPLAQIRGYTDILEAMNEQKMLDPEQTINITGNLRKATDRLERLIADMLDVSQLGLDAMDLRFSPTTIDSVIKLAIEPLNDAINQRKLQMTARGLRGLPTLEADMQRLVQAIRNVVLNAIKYTPDGGRIDVTARAEKNEHTDKDEILVIIRDSGIGIDQKYQELVFEKFFRIADPGLHSTGATKFMGAGPGLGLTIARGVVQGHGGKIWLESMGHDPSNFPGTTVYIRLPVTPPANAKRVLPFETTTMLKAAPKSATATAPVTAG